MGKKKQYMKAAGWVSLTGEQHYLSAMPRLSLWWISRGQRSHPFILAEETFFPGGSLEAYAKNAISYYLYKHIGLDRFDELAAVHCNGCDVR